MTEIAPAKAIRDPLPIRLQAITFDPLAGEPALPADQRAETLSTAENYYLVQFDGPILNEWQKALDATGAQRLGYVPEFAYIVRMSADQEPAVSALPHIRWIGLYQPGYKISPELANDASGRRKITIVTFPGVDMDALKGKISELGGSIDESSQNEQSGMFRIEIDGNQVVPLARLPGVMWIEPYTAPSFH